jgi:hypothetical protein
MAALWQRLIHYQLIQHRLGQTQGQNAMLLRYLACAEDLRRSEASTIADAAKRKPLTIRHECAKKGASDAQSHDKQLVAGSSPAGGTIYASVAQLDRATALHA